MKMIKGEIRLRRRTAKRTKPRPGFGILEAMVAVTILAIMLLTLISVFLYGYGAVARARQAALATQIVQEKMEAVRSLPFDSIAGLGTSFSDNDLTGLPGGTGILAVEAGPGNDIKKVTIGVRWTYRGAACNKTLVTYMTRKGINRI
jgi:type II secretory pathway pseudopilin PulG